MLARCPTPRPRDPLPIVLLCLALACGDGDDGGDDGDGGNGSGTDATGDGTTADDGDDGDGQTGDGDSGGTGDGGTSGDDGGTGDGSGTGTGMGTDDGGTTSSTGDPVEPPPYTPLHRIDVRVHRGASDLSDQNLRDIFAEMNFIWRSQAGVCFEFEAVTHEDVRQGGFDLWFIRNSDPRVSGFNGVYRGDHDILSRDEPGLSNVSNPAMYNAARTAAHELGHGLTLNHTNDAGTWGADHRENLMASGTKGWHIPVEPQDPRDQVLQSRDRAQQKAVPDGGELECGAPVFR